IKCSLRVFGRISTFLSALSLKLMDIGACQPLSARIPLKPTQVPLQVPAAAKPQTQCWVSRSASELFLASPPPCITINSGFKT
ncbi:hypothetical protein DFH08DRAFT_906107, partial [Mycena albidolilacea]